jgi:hypothetical protein
MGLGRGIRLSFSGLRYPKRLRQQKNDSRVSNSVHAVRPRGDHQSQTRRKFIQYALLIHPGDSGEAWEKLSEDERNAVFGEYMAITQAPGVLGGNQLQPVETATTVRVQDGQTLTTDGPFAETKDALGGYYLFEADDLDAAIELAARIPAARMGGGVEVRPVVER